MVLLRRLYTTILGGCSAVFLALTTASSAWAEYQWELPEPVTPIAHDTLAIHREFMLIITILFVLVFAIMVYSMLKHRKSVGAKPAKFTGPKNKLEWLYVTIPFIILLIIDYVLLGIPAVKAVIVMEDTRTKAEMVVKVVGMQWKWQYEYPDENISFLSTLSTPPEQMSGESPKGENYLLEVDNPLVLPVDTKVRVLLAATDVIHSWWVPQFGVKRDAIPGFIRETWVKIERPGIYRGQCTELCGKNHGYMPVVVHAMPKAEYAEWLQSKKAEQLASADAAAKAWSMAELMAKGEEVYGAQCAVCHQANGQGLPPVFPALTNSPAIKKALFDAEGNYTADGHIDRVFNGKAGTAMQAFGKTLSDIDIAAVITYERNALGNSQGDMVQPAQIKNLRTQ